MQAPCREAPRRAPVQRHNFQRAAIMSQGDVGSKLLNLPQNRVDSGNIDTNQLKWQVRTFANDKEVALMVGCDPGMSSTNWKVDAEVRLHVKNGDEILGTIEKRLLFTARDKPAKIVYSGTESNPFSICKKSKSVSTIFFHFSNDNSAQALVEIEVFSISVASTLDHMEPDNFEVLTRTNNLTITVESKRFYVNRELFRVFSSHFRVLIEKKEYEKENHDSDEDDEKGRIEIELENATADEILTLIRAIHPTKQQVDESNVETLLKLGKRFGVPSVLISCDRFLRSGEANKIDKFKLLNWSVQYNLPDLQDFVMNTLTHKSYFYPSPKKMPPEKISSVPLEMKIYQDGLDQRVIEMEKMKWNVKVRGHVGKVELEVVCDPGTTSTFWNIDAEIRLWIKKSDNLASAAVMERRVFSAKMKPLLLEYIGAEHEPFDCREYNDVIRKSPVDGSLSDWSHDNIAHINFTAPHNKSDLTIVVEGKHLHAHETILKVKKEREIQLETGTYEEIEFLLRAIYPSMQRVNLTNVEQLLKVGHQYGVSSILIDCERFLNSEEAKKIDKFLLLHWSFLYKFPDIQHKIFSSFDKMESFCAVQDSPAWDLMEDEEKVIILEKMLEISKKKPVFNFQFNSPPTIKKTI
ncbi:unnamed protein product [Caenorhabditis auriculariae]|uniref:BTB domain-containing protein n=1 Tax=Caenorhabditis auriculariae TaxID=2777116 RepID=A0A8S1HTQ1_9PELO|nr:unnamed protein product [Caenorhabditis auriculariae]